MNTFKTFLSLSILFCFSNFYGQTNDSVRLFPKIKEQYNSERILKNNYYYNPASMSDYSSLSLSEFKISYHNDRKNAYRAQLGSGETGFQISADSYKKLRKNNFIWGNASYSNLNLKNITWNEDLDFERIGPYVLGDSVGGNKKLEIYQFGGGFGKQYTKFSYALTGNYKAQMAYRDRDPRSKNTTSDLTLRAGVNYDVYKNYQIGAFAEINKYTQSGSIKFVSEVSKPLIYQMVGFGFSNNFFSSEYASVQFEEFGYKIGGQISSKNGKDFYLRGSYKNSTNTKSVITKNSNTYYDASELEHEFYDIEGAKFFNFGNHRTGLLLNYSSSIRTGYEFGYTNNTTLITQIYKRAAYKKEDYYSTAKLFYQYSKDDFTASITPYFTFEETIDRRIYPFSGQKFDFYTFGFESNIQKEIAKNQVISFQPTFSYRVANSAVNALDQSLRPSIAQWIENDYKFLSSDVISFGAALRYDIKLDNLPSMFITGAWLTQRILEKNNNFGAVSLGITF